MKDTKLKESDFYHDEDGNLVFTASYHKRRGYCCQSGCRHCPYEIDTQVDASSPLELNLEKKKFEISIEDLAELYLSEHEEN